MIARVLSQGLIVLNAAFMDWKKEYYLLCSVPIALAGTKTNITFNEQLQ
jgi:hypothetical protein